MHELQQPQRQRPARMAGPAAVARMRPVEELFERVRIVAHADTGRVMDRARHRGRCRIPPLWRGFAAAIAQTQARRRPPRYPGKSASAPSLTISVSTFSRPSVRDGRGGMPQ